MFHEESKMDNDEMTVDCAYILSKTTVESRRNLFPFMTLGDIELLAGDLNLSDHAFDLYLTRGYIFMGYVVGSLYNEWAVLQGHHWMDLMITVGCAKTYAGVVAYIVTHETSDLTSKFATWTRNHSTGIVIFEIRRQDRLSHLYSQGYNEDFTDAFMRAAADILDYDQELRAAVENANGPYVRSLAGYVCDYFQQCRHAFWIACNTRHYRTHSIPTDMGYLVAEAATSSRRYSHGSMVELMANALEWDKDNVVMVIQNFRARFL